MNEVSVHGLMAGVEALTRSKVGTIFYDFLENIDSLQMALVINSAPKTLNHEQLLDYFRATEVSDKTHVSLQEAISLFKVIMNSLNNTVNQEYFSERIIQPVFIQVLKDTGEEAKLSDDTQIKVSDFIAELKRVAPFSVKFFSSYFEHVFLKQHDLSGLHMFDA